MSEKARTVYISGAITGIHNYQDYFKKAEDHIKAFGLKTLNPVEFCKGMELIGLNEQKNVLRMQ